MSEAAVRGDRTRTVAAVVVIVLGLFNAFWRLGTADWRTDEHLDGLAAWKAVNRDWSLVNGHPVFVRWFLGLGQVVFGQTRFGVRIFPVLFSLGTAVLLFAFGRQIAGFWTGLIAGGTWALLPRPLLVGWQETFAVRSDRFAYLEPYASFFLVAATWAGWRWLRNGRWQAAVGTGALVGFGMAFKPTVGLAIPAIIVAALVLRRGAGHVLAHGVAMGAMAAGVMAFSYLPLGRAGPRNLWGLFDFQAEHLATGHPLVVAGSRTLRQAWWTNFWFQWHGTGAIVTLALVAMSVAALTSRHRVIAAYIFAVGLTVAVGHALSPIALPHYHLLWMPLLVLLAAIGIVYLLEQPGRWAIAGAVALAVLLVAAGAGTRRIATLPDGDYQRVADAVTDAGVEPTFIVYAGEPIGRYFDDVPIAFLGLGDNHPADLMVLDLGYAQYLTESTVEGFRRQALRNGLTYHRVGELEAWWR